MSWSEEASYRLPVALWRDMMDLYFPNTRLAAARPRDARCVCSATRPQRALLTWDETFEQLLKEAGDEGVNASVAPTLHRSSGPVRSARLVADTVLYEGYVLYPYRASAQKNQLRWQFGVLAPPPLRRVDGLRALVDAQRGDRRSR